VGADRKGPLAAFVVIAIIAAILLVTSVRSQAEPSLVAEPPAVTYPDLWAPAADLQVVVRSGVTLVRKIATAATVVRDPSVTTAATSVPDTGSLTALPAVSHRVVGRMTRRRSPHPSHRVRRHAKPSTTAPPKTSAPPTTSAPPAPGRHLGWGHGKPGHGRHLGSKGKAKGKHQA
jgi:hypothetical protein